MKDIQQVPSGTLITCPICVDKKPVLGRLMETGEFMILRFHHGTTVVQVDAMEYKVKCGCGYTIHIANGAVVTSMPAQL